MFKIKDKTHTTFLPLQNIRSIEVVDGSDEMEIIARGEEGYDQVWEFTFENYDEAMATAERISKAQADLLNGGLHA